MEFDCGQKYLLKWILSRTKDISLFGLRTAFMSRLISRLINFSLRLKRLILLIYYSFQLHTTGPLTSFLTYSSLCRNVALNLRQTLIEGVKNTNCTGYLHSVRVLCSPAILKSANCYAPFFYPDIFYCKKNRQLCYRFQFFMFQSINRFVRP